VRRLTAVDLFCGGGGLTEGFKQLDVDVEACLDIWGPAVETHRKNHPETEVFQADILEFNPMDLPKPDVLIGSPPCTEFSYANRGGHGDTALGMRFVLRFLRFVHDLSPKYWIMENVPRLAQTLPPRVPLRRLGLTEPGFLEIPVRRILNSADYGVPQKRLRLISGNFPLPQPTHAWSEGNGIFSELPAWVPVKTVLEHLPDPLGHAGRDGAVTDPCYQLQIPETDLTEHFFDTRLSPEEAEVNRKAKTDHSWYGRMSFPDPLDRPARTVMATQTGISRETLVIEVDSAEGISYRRPTIRECASFQSFPITYQFWGSTAQTRYKVIGNAVPPLMAGALARAMLQREGLRIPTSPILTKTVAERPSLVTLEPTSRRRKGPTYPEGRKFRDHVPGSKGQGVRVDLANVVAASAGGEGQLEVTWEARLIVGSGKSVQITKITLPAALSLLAAWAHSADRVPHVERFLSELQKAIERHATDAENLQAAWSHRLARPRVTPPAILRAIGKLVDKHFPEAISQGLLVEIPREVGDVGRPALPIRTCAQLTAVASVVDTATRGGSALSLRAAFTAVPRRFPSPRSKLVAG
jgi:DNA (cytosine-5)-methyltransferase 1